MKCVNILREKADSVLPSLNFPASIYPPDTKLDMYLDLQSEAAIRLFGDIGTANLSFSNNAAGLATTKVNDRTIVFYPMADFLTVGLNKKAVLHKESNMEAATNTFKEVLSKLNVEDEVDMLIAEGLQLTSQRIQYESTGISTSDMHQITLSAEELKSTASLLNTTEKKAAQMMILHELVHANTMFVLAAAEVGNESATKLTRQANKLYARYVKAYRKNPFAPTYVKDKKMLSLPEFLSISVSDKQFAEQLENADTGLFDTIWNFIQRLLGVESPSSIDVYKALAVDNSKYTAYANRTKRHHFNAGESAYYKQAHNQQDVIEMLIANNSKFLNELDENGKELNHYLNADTNAQIARLTGFDGTAALFTSMPKHTLEKIAEIVAAMQFVNMEEGALLAVGADGEVLTKAKFIEYFINRVEKSQIKGHIQHAIAELVIAELTGQAPNPEVQQRLAQKKLDYTKYETNQKYLNFNWAFEATRTYFKSTGINLDSKNKVTGHTAVTEVMVHSSVLNFASRADAIFQRNIDGKLLLFDFKTGFDVLKEEFPRILNEYSNGYALIGDNAKGIAKLELMLRAIAIKEQRPQTQFSGLRISNVQSGSISAKKISSDYVDVEAYLDMIKHSLKDKAFCVKAGFMKETDTELPYDRLVAKSPLIFEPSEYMDSRALLDIDVATNTEPSNILNSKITRLRGKIATQFITKSNLNQQEIAELTEEVIQLAAVDSEAWNVHAADLNIMQEYLGTQQEYEDPQARAWGKMYDKAVVDFNVEQSEVELKLTGLAETLYKEWAAEQGHKITTRGLRTIIQSNAAKTGLYDYAYKDIVENGIPSQRLYDDFVDVEYMKKLSAKEKEAYLLEREEDKQAMSKFTAAQKEYLQYVNSLSRRASAEYNVAKYEAEEISDSGSKITKKYSALDLFNNTNSYTKDFQKRTMKPGFFWKIPRLAEEKKRAGKKNIAAVIEADNKLNKLTAWQKASNWVKQGLIDCEDTEFFGETMPPIGIPIKGLGNFKVDTSKVYSMDLTASTLAGYSNMLSKKHYDDVIVLGNGLMQYYKQRSFDEHVDYTGYQTNIENTLYRKLLGVTKPVSAGKHPITISYVDTFGNKKTAIISWPKILRKLSKFSIAGIMPLRILQPLGSGAQAYLTLHRDLMSNSFYKKFIAKNKFDELQSYDIKDLRRAHGMTNSIVKDTAAGSIRDNKLWLLSQHMGFIPKSYIGNSIRNNNKVVQTSLFSEQSLYVLQNAQEDFITYLTLSYQMLNFKHTYKGVTKNLYDWYAVKDGKLVWEGGTRGVMETSTIGGEFAKVEGLTQKEIVHMKAVYEHLQGGYRQEELTAIEATALGAAFMSLMRWLPRLIHQSVHGRKKSTVLGTYIQKKNSITNELEYYEDAETGEKIPVLEWRARETEGKWISMVHGVGWLFSGSPSTKWKAASDMEKKNILEGTIGLLIWGASWLVYTMAIDDEDEDKTLVKLSKRYLIDNLSQQYNPWNLIKSATKMGQVLALKQTYEFSNNLLLFLTSVALLGFTDEGKVEYQDLIGTTPYLNQIDRTDQYIEMIDGIDSETD